MNRRLAMDAFTAMREQARKRGIAARDGLTQAEREAFSRQIAERILQLPVFQSAGTILLYRAARGEVRLQELEEAAASVHKRLVYPICLTGREMAAFSPEDAAAWTKNRYGIEEPDRACAALIGPEEIDLIICPCTAFDAACNRMGMGGGFYDRYLPQCSSAYIIAAAFEVQKTAQIPAMPWDYPLQAVYTEKAVYRRGHGAPVL